MVIINFINVVSSICNFKHFLIWCFPDGELGKIFFNIIFEITGAFE